MAGSFLLHNRNRPFCAAAASATPYTVMAPQPWVVARHRWVSIPHNSSWAFENYQKPWVEPMGTYALCQIVSGIAAIFYVLIYPEPWSVLPFNAFMNASASICLFLILKKFVSDERKSLIALLPFLLYPSSFQWNAQFHNENTVIPGMFFVLLGWVSISIQKTNNEDIHFTSMISAFFLIALGSLLLNLTRDYIFIGIVYLFSTTGCGLGIYWTIQKIRQNISSAEYLLRIVSISILIITMSVISFTTRASSRKSSVDIFAPSTSTSEFVKNWQKVTWLPTVIDNQIKNISTYRNRFVKQWDHGGSSIDLDVTFNNAADFFTYIPRAFQIGFLSPFPNIWLIEGKKAMGAATRVISGLETIVSYTCLFGLLFFLHKNRKQPAVWAIIFVCSSMLILYAMITPNQGALYRFRYPYFMPLISLGLAGWISRKTKSLTL